jgi:hypothetical protein
MMSKGTEPSRLIRAISLFYSGVAHWWPWRWARNLAAIFLGIVAFTSSVPRTCAANNLPSTSILPSGPGQPNSGSQAVQTEATNALVSLQMPAMSLPNVLEFYGKLAHRKLIFETPLTGGSITLVREDKLTIGEAVNLVEKALREQAKLVLIHLDAGRSFVVKADPEWERLERELSATPDPDIQDGRYRGKSVREWVDLAVSTSSQNKPACLAVVRLGTVAEPYLIEGLDATPGIKDGKATSSQESLERDSRRSRCAFWLGRVEPISSAGMSALQGALADRPPVSQTAADSLERILERSPERLAEFTAMLPELRRSINVAAVHSLVRLIENGGKADVSGPGIRRGGGPPRAP